MEMCPVFWQGIFSQNKGRKTMKNKVTDIDKAIGLVKSGCSLMMTGFGQAGSPRHLIRALAGTDVKDLHTISDDLGVTEHGFDQTIAALVKNKQISKAQCCFVGQNPGAGKQYIDGTLDIEFIPMGTFAERIRAGGAGIGGFYTKTGVGTMVEEGKETKILNGEKYLLELPLHADVAFLHAYMADTAGNAIFKYTARNYNPVMATAADIVILEAEKIVELGEIAPDAVQLPGVFVDYVVEAKEDIL